MKILLLNKNPIISKLVKLSAEKIGYDFEEKEKYKKGLKADIIIVDSEIELDLKELSSECLKLIYLSAKKDEKKDADGFISISKPFLPTDLLELIQEKETQAIDTEEKVSEDKNPYDDMNIDLDNLNFQIDETKEDKTEEVKEENKDKEEPKEEAEDEFLEESLDFGGIDETQDKEQKDQVIDDEKNENFDEHDLDEALKLSEEEKNEKIDEYIDKDEDLSLDFKDTQDEQEQKYIFGTEEELQTQTDTIDIKDDEIKVDEDELNINEDLKDLKPEEKHETLKDGEESSENTELKDEFLHEDFLSLEQNLDTNKEEEIKENLTQNETQMFDLDNILHENLDSEQPFVVEEKKEEEINFDDIPQDAKFIGQDEDEESIDEIKPSLLENDEINVEEKSVQEKIKEELAILNEMDEAPLAESDNDPILENLENKNFIDISDENTSFKEDLKSIKQADIQKALGEEFKAYDDESKETNENLHDNEIINELSQGIASAIKSSIKDDALKAALKGMNMNINISINFSEDKN